ncbi:MAG TPA: hypothetical protein PLW44_07765 [Chitinophagales bacterium]|nr:hypothetical protein [Chitinophagales bacterium]
MLETINKENFNQVLARFSVTELEGLLQKFPYFQQAHLLLAKKYQDQNDPRFDQQLQLAALYTHDRDLFYSVFNPNHLSAPLGTPITTTVETELHKLPEIPVSEAQETTAHDDHTAIVTTPEQQLPEHSFELSPETAVAEVEIVTETIDVAPAVIITETPVVTDVEPVAEITPVQDSVVDNPQNDTEAETPEVVLTEETAEIAEPAVEEETIETTPAETFDTNQPHTFDEWLRAYSPAEEQNTAPVVGLQQQEIPAEPEKQDEELEKLYVANIPVNLHELVEEETNYSKGLDKFIEEQRLKHRAPAVKPPVAENDIDPDLITETMAKVYEMQKKYAKAIRSYEILGLKYPEKNDFFAARINYLKNIT